MRGLSYLTKKAAVVERLRSEILGGSLAAGTPLQQEEVAARLSVSPTPVREAFRALEAEGLVESRPHHGVVVARHDYADIREIYEVRIAVELKALERAIDRLDATVLGNLDDVLDRSRRAVARGDLASFRRANGDFHRIITNAAHSRIYSELGQSLIDRSTHFGPLLTRARTREIHAQHAGIYAALRGKDRTRALRLMETHLEVNLRLLPKTGAAVNQRGPRRNGTG